MQTPSQKEPVSASSNLVSPGPIAADAHAAQVATAGQGALLARPALLRTLDRGHPGYDG